jgi:hypothetical protein
MKSRITANQPPKVLVEIFTLFFLTQCGCSMSHGWQTYFSPDGSFSIEFPGKPTVETEQLPRKSGGTGTLHFVHFQSDGNRDYWCSYAEIHLSDQDTPDKVLEFERDDNLRKVQGTVLTQNRFLYQGYPALQYQAHTAKSMLMDSRMVVVGNRLYMLMALSASGGSSETKTVQRMFDSFKVTSK